MIGIAISENDDNYGRPLKYYIASLSLCESELFFFLAIILTKQNHPIFFSKIIGDRDVQNFTIHVWGPRGFPRIMISISPCFFMLLLLLLNYWRNIIIFSAFSSYSIMLLLEVGFVFSDMHLFHTCLENCVVWGQIQNYCNLWVREVRNFTSAK